MGLSARVLIVLVCVITMDTNLRCEAKTTGIAFLKAHNTARAEVGVPPVEWDNKLALFARGYAWIRSRDCELVHSGTPMYGENLAAGSWDMSPEEAVKIWTDEKNLYDVRSNACVGGELECLHYTQVVWRSSARIGCAKARCLNGWTFVTCNYDPPGNYIGERPF